MENMSPMWSKPIEYAGWQAEWGLKMDVQKSLRWRAKAKACLVSFIVRRPSILAFTSDWSHLGEEKKRGSVECSENKKLKDQNIIRL